MGALKVGVPSCPFIHTLHYQCMIPLVIVQLHDQGPSKV